MSRKEEITNQLVRITEQILNDARTALYMDQHYMALPLGALRYAVNTELPGIGTDGEYLAVHPKHLADLYEKDRRLVNRIYLHQIYHCLFRHIFKRIRSDRELWMLACDMAVEYLIDSQNNRSTRMGRSAIRERWRTQIQGHVKVLNAEGIYEAAEKACTGSCCRGPP